MTLLSPQDIQSVALFVILGQGCRNVVSIRFSFRESFLVLVFLLTFSILLLWLFSSETPGIQIFSFLCLFSVFVTLSQVLSLFFFCFFLLFKNTLPFLLKQ